MPPFLFTIAGLPAHPLVVHAAVVLVPLAAVFHVATGWRPTWRRVYALPAAAVGIAGAVFAWLAKASGEPLEDSVKSAARAVGQRARFGDHPEQGDAGFAVLAFVERKRPLPRWAPLAAWAAAGIIGVVAIATMTVAGHSGAQLVWKDVGTFAAGGG